MVVHVLYATLVVQIGGAYRIEREGGRWMVGWD
jgi:hypothetical protein